jgi:hypothetical protein
MRACLIASDEHRRPLSVREVQQAQALHRAAPGRALATTPKPLTWPEDLVETLAEILADALLADIRTYPNLENVQANSGSRRLTRSAYAPREAGSRHEATPESISGSGKSRNRAARQEHLPPPRKTARGPPDLETTRTQPRLTVTPAGPYSCRTDSGHNTRTHGV